MESGRSEARLTNRKTEEEANKDNKEDKYEKTETGKENSGRR